MTENATTGIAADPSKWLTARCHTILGVALFPVSFVLSTLHQLHDKMALESKRVPELRKLAKERGIKPIPTRKADLIKALKGETPSYTVEDLRRICEKHKESLKIACRGRGITRKYLVDKLTEAGLIMEIEEKKQSDYEEKLRTADPELHRVLEALAPHVLTLDIIVGTKVGRKKVSQAEDPWRFLYSEYSALTTALKTKKPWQRIYQLLKEQKALPKTLHKAFTVFSKALPLITYAFLIEQPELQKLADSLKLEKLFSISDVLKGTNAFLSRSADVETEAEAAEEVGDMLSALPSELLYEIMRHLPSEDVGSTVVASRSALEAEERYRSLSAAYGNYTLSRAQKTARDWIYSRDEIVVGVEAPPSWGKTALAIAVAIDSIKSGKTVVMHTTPAMIPFFVEEMEQMMGKKFPDLKGPLEQPGKYRLLVPSFSAAHNARYKAGEQADLLLINVPREINTRYHNRIPFQTVDSPIDRYAPDVIILDEAHKHNPGIIYSDYNSRKRPDRLILLSASPFSQIIRRVFTKPAYLRFSLASIAAKVPDFAVEIQDIPQFIETDAEMRGGYTGDAVAAIERAELLRQLDQELIGNTIVFSRDPLRMTGTLAKTKKNLEDSRITYQDNAYDAFDLYSEKVLRQPKSIVVYKGPKTIKKFQDQSRQTPSTLFLTYRVGAEGLNLDTVDNVVLLDTTKVDNSTVFQAVARAQRVSNPRHTIRVITYAKPTFGQYLRTVFRFSQGFESSTRTYFKRSMYDAQYQTIENYRAELKKDVEKGTSRPLGRYKAHKLPIQLYSYVMTQKDKISVAEMSLIFHTNGLKKTPTEIAEFLVSQKLLPEVDPLGLAVYLNRYNTSLTQGEAEIAAYKEFQEQINSISLEQKVEQLERERLRHIVI